MSALSAFQSRYRAASHFRLTPAGVQLQQVPISFNLVIERLLISGRKPVVKHRAYKAVTSFQSRYRAASHFRLYQRVYPLLVVKFQSRYRAASHFRNKRGYVCVAPVPCFNLVIERLLISGPSTIVFAPFTLQFQSRYRAASHFRSLPLCLPLRCKTRFNLVIERLLISGSTTDGWEDLFTLGFNLVIERLLISGWNG